MSYEILDNIADSYIPILAFAAVCSLVLSLRFNTESFKKFGVQFFSLAVQVLVVYGLMFIDGEFRLMHTIGLDYSTHTALSLVLVLFLSNNHSKLRAIILGSFVAYVLLMLYQKYHTVNDIGVTALVVGGISLGINKLIRPGS